MSKFLYYPIYTNTDKMLNLVADIAVRVDVLTIHSGMEQNPKLRRSNRIRSIHSSLAIENNTLPAVELMNLLNLKHRPTFRKNYLHPALEAELIEMTLPDTPNAKGQKYRKKR